MVAGDVQNGLSIIQLTDHFRENEFEGRKETKNTPPAELEDALTATAIPVAWAGAFDITSMAFILASAECDLELTFVKKGALVSSVYFGMMMSSFFWSFATDRLSRKPLMLLGLIIDALCNILCCIVESYYIMLLLKFITGTIVSGPFTLLIPYVNEFQPVNYRQNFTTWSGLVFNAGLIIPAILAFNITPQRWSFVLLDHEYTAWRIFLMTCTLPSIIGIVTMSLFSESPKRLIETEHVTKVLSLLRRMYVINNFKSPDTYPIKSLQSIRSCIREIPKTNVDRIKGTWSDIKELCNKKYWKPFFIINFLQFGSILGFNIMRLWVPHMFMIINNFDPTMWDWSAGNPTMCDYLSRAVIPEGPTNDTLYANNCAQWRINPIIYVRSTIIAFSTVVFAFLFAQLYTTRLRKRIAMTFCYVVAIISSFIANWVQLVPIMLVLSSSIVVTGRITGNIVIAINTTTIPLPLRTTAVSFINNTGNLATIVGNLIFSCLLGFHCYSAFVGIGCILLLCLVLSFFTLTLPKDRMDTKM
ncbi:uncharacterized protein LOC135160150 isoform X2 [Diachasmimorpha longicaudata]|uniref:uncharacterized protein LOC135160150 isoform X2 n=1 Tax=Diachasmimorpha longicaudata TaxID=58733 RepID=UPI0030B87F04